MNCRPDPPNKQPRSKRDPVLNLDDVDSAVILNTQRIYEGNHQTVGTATARRGDEHRMIYDRTKQGRRKNRYTDRASSDQNDAQKRGSGQASVTTGGEHGPAAFQEPKGLRYGFKKDPEVNSEHSKKWGRGQAYRSMDRQWLSHLPSHQWVSVGRGVSLCRVCHTSRSS